MVLRKAHPLLFTLGSNRDLAWQTSRLTGLPLSSVDLSHYADGETFAKIKDDVKGCHVYLIQSTFSPVNERLMDLLDFADAAKRAGARKLTAIVPYYGYARQDRVVERGDPVTGMLVGKLMKAAGVDTLVVVDFHSLSLLEQLPLKSINLSAASLFAEALKPVLKKNGVKESELSIVATDHGGIRRVKELSAYFPQAGLAYADKVRPAPNEARVEKVLGDVRGRVCLIYDDIIDTAGTLREVVKALEKEGAKDVYVAATHGVYSSGCLENLSSIREGRLYTSDSIERDPPIGEVVSLSPLLASYIEKDAK